MKLTKLKKDKKFEPIQVEADDELYPNGIFEFNISRLIIFLQENPERFKVEDVNVDTLSMISSNLDEDTVQNADLCQPIILAQIGPHGFNVIDGNHRVEKARRTGIKIIPAYKVDEHIHPQFLTSVRAYKTYIDYWNEKVLGLKKQQKKI